MMADVQVKRKANYTVHERSSVQSLPTTGLPPRPRAKISSSANVVAAGRKSAGKLTPGYASGASTPRAPSPTKQLSSQTGRLSPRPTANTLSRMRSKANMSAASAPNSPLVDNSQQARSAIPATALDFELAKPSLPRVRHVSISSMSQLSSVSSARANGALSRTSSVVSCPQDTVAHSSVSTRRIKAKVTGLAIDKPPATSIPLTPASLRSISPAISGSLNATHQRIARTASISSLSSTAKEPPFYPITTASPAANVHRFAAARIPSSSHRPAQCFSSPLQPEHKPAHVDPAVVPLPPPLSPPSSTVSFSSHSSMSRSPTASANNGPAPTFSLNANSPCDGQPVVYSTVKGANGRSGKSRSSSIVIHDLSYVREQHGRLSEVDSDEVEEEKTIRAEAKTNRKIADLEITNKSLLVINTQLEANKHKQTKEICELRRKLRESRLILPPHAYRELKSSIGVEDFHKDEEELDSEGHEEDAEANTSAEILKMGKEDELFNRVRCLIDNLLETGRRALESKVEDFAPPKGAARVLHEEEARSWRDGRRESESGTRMPADREVGDDTFDEIFVTAKSGNDSLRWVSFALKDENVRKGEWRCLSET